jgi:hypothetical protein
MDESYHALAREDASLCGLIQAQLAELDAMEAAWALEDKVMAGPSLGTRSMLASLAAGTSTVALVMPTPVTEGPLTRAPATSTPVRSTVSFEVEDEGKYEDFGAVTYDEDASLDNTNVKLMLEKSVKASTREKYSRLWDKCVSFSIFHGMSMMPPEMRGLEIFCCGLVRYFWFSKGSELHRSGRGAFLRLGRVPFPVHLTEVLKDLESNTPFAREGGQAQEIF